MSSGPAQDVSSAGGATTREPSGAGCTPATHVPGSHAVPHPGGSAAALVGVGIDLVDPGRLAAALARRAGLAGRILTDAELRWAAARELGGTGGEGGTAGTGGTGGEGGTGDAGGARVDPGRAAMAFAAKEATMKALRRGLDSLGLREIELRPGSASGTGAGLVLSGRALVRARELGVQAAEVDHDTVSTPTGDLVRCVVRLSGPRSPTAGSGDGG